VSKPNVSLPGVQPDYKSHLANIIKIKPKMCCEAEHVCCQAQTRLQHSEVTVPKFTKFYVT